MRYAAGFTYLLLVLSTTMCLSVSSFGLMARQPRYRVLHHRGGAQPVRIYNTKTDRSMDGENGSKDAPPLSTKKNSSPVIVSAGVLLTAVTAAAKFGILPGPVVVLPDGNGGLDSTTGIYETAFILQDIAATVSTGLLAYIFVKVNTWACEQEYVEPRDSRKIIHTLSAPLFMLTWPLFSNAVGARFFAAIVPTLNMIRLLRASQGDEAELARAVSRSGDKKEALGGPFIYVIIMITSIILFWKSSPVGVMALSTMAAGDGMADLVGRRFGANNKWPGLNKSAAGTAAFWAASTVSSTGLLLWLQKWGSLTVHTSALDGAAVQVQDLLGPVAAISLVAAILELVPIWDDNYTVPAAAALLTMIFLQ